MSAPSKGLPMTAKWDPERLQREQAELQALEQQPLLTRIRGYMKLTGPAWLQSAMTLGAGSATASVVAGAFFGYQLLWVQPLAMFLGVLMMAALGNIVLSTGERPYRSFGRELSPTLAFLWAFGSIVASVIWHFPQYGLAGAVAWDLANVAGVPDEKGWPYYAVRFAVGGAILGINIFTTWNYGSGSRGMKLYEGFLRWMIRLVIIAFAVVVIMTGVNWGALWRGFFTFQLPDTAAGVTVVLGAIGAAVGINMTFLYPYSILAKGWGKYHKGLSRWDLFSSMFLPYVLLTSLIIIAMANTKFQPTEAVTAAAMQSFKPVDAAGALTGVVGDSLGRVIFDLGFLAMALGAISTHMVVCGFTMCEMLGLEYTTKRYRMFTLVPAVGILGVIWPGPFWMPIAASAICLTMLPIAYLAFFIMNNKRSYLGDAVGRGWRRLLFNVGLLAAITAATVGASVQIKKRVIDKLWPSKPSVTSETPATPDAKP